MSRRASKTKVLGRPQALAARSHPRSVAAYVDFDYIGTLTPTDRTWLAIFVDQHYGGDYRGDPWGIPPADRRRTYQDKNRANRDLYARTCTPGEVPPDPPAPAADPTPAPAYLATEAYRQALAAWRTHVDERTTTTQPGQWAWLALGATIEPTPATDPRSGV